jgi:molecular chaperone GrpE
MSSDYQNPEDTVSDGDGRLPSFDQVEFLTATNELLMAEVAEYKGVAQRVAADFANYKRRMAEERENEAGLANESLWRKLLAILDDFDRAVKAAPQGEQETDWSAGVAQIDRKFHALLENEGITQINARGEAFDPRYHESLVTLTHPEVADGMVLDEISKGYLIGEKVLRHSQVSVSSGPEPPPSKEDSQLNSHHAPEN